MAPYETSLCFWGLVPFQLAISLALLSLPIKISFFEQFLAPSLALQLAVKAVHPVMRRKSGSRLESLIRGSLPLGLVIKLEEQPVLASWTEFNKKVTYSGAFVAFSDCEVVQVALFCWWAKFSESTWVMIFVVLTCCRTLLWVNGTRLEVTAWCLCWQIMQ